MRTRTLIPAIMLSALLCIPAALTAQTVVEERHVGAFTGVETSSVFRVHLIQGDYISLEIEAPEEHMEHIETIVEDGILFIDYTERARNLTDLMVHITAPDFTYLHAGGASAISSVSTITSHTLKLKVSGASRMDLTVEADHLTTDISGACNIKLAGRATLHEITASGVSGVRAYDLETITTDVNSSGTSTVRITVLESLTADVSGTSSVIYRGDPPLSDYTTSVTASVRPAEPIPSPVPDDEVEEEKDTVVISVGRREVVIVDGRMPEIRTRQRPRMQWRSNWSGFYLGINGYLTPGNSINLDPEDEYLNLEYNNSIQVNLNIWEQNLVLARGNNGMVGLVSGLGVSWNNYRFSENIRLVHDADGLAHDYDDDIHSFRKNKLTVSHLNLPFMLEFQHRAHSYNQFHMSAGVNVGLRLRSHTKQVYRHEGSRVKDKDFRDFHLAPFRYEAVARIGWGRINLFATYALNSMFREDKGPELYPFSAGIRLLNF